ncbi:ferritin-like domain-containing protein [uncultured Proteiniphilum sp.]|uniref:YciE/YciF ferroxidase family protein n=1 Tax=uncultured Proteiniphilum sp. TaxID=497637 RepID=UPI00262FAD28|nr:ferritin-like domain-containing protein [uncultured Proteiniphilum sp.]
MDSINEWAHRPSESKDIIKKRQNARFNEKFEGKLKEFFVEELKDIYFAEGEILKGLEKMEAAALSTSLKASLQDHHTETEEQIERLKEVFGLVGEEPSKKKCEAIMGILKEGDTMLGDTEEDSMVRDVAIIIACQKVEHYEIATYGSLAELARTLGLDEAADILEEILEEEKSADVGLTELAVESVNEEAKEEGEKNEDPDRERSDREDQVNDFQEVTKRSDYREGDSDSEYPSRGDDDAIYREDKWEDDDRIYRKGDGQGYDDRIYPVDDDRRIKDDIYPPGDEQEDYDDLEENA